MELPSLSNTANKNVGTVSQQFLQLANIKAGATFIAEVQSVSKIDQNLISKILKALPTPPGNSFQSLPRSDTAAKDDVLKNLLRQPSILFAIKLKILGKAVLTFSQTELAPQQRVQVTVRQDGQLQLASKHEPNKPVLENPGSNKQPLPNNVSQNNPATEQFLQKTASRSHLQQGTEGITLQAGLRRYLSGSIRLSDIFATIDRLSIPANMTSSGKQLNDILATLNRFRGLATPVEELNTARAIKSALSNSGATLEAKLASLLTSPLARSASPPGALSSAVKETLAQDLKAQTLRSLFELTGVESGLPKSTHFPQVDKDTLTALEKLLLSLLTSSKPAPAQTANPQHHTQNLAGNTLQALLGAIISRITYLQIQQRLATSGEKSIGPGIGAELPVRIGDAVYPLYLQIKPADEENESRKKSNERKAQNESNLKRKWQVFMIFDLDNLGTFASEISVCDDIVNAALWVEKSRLWQASQQRLEQLRATMEDSGVHVETLVCLQGKPPENPTRIHQSLVDVRT